MPFFLDPARIPFYLYVPNLVGYVRVITLVMACLQEDPASRTALRCLYTSLALDFIDGPLARRLNMCTQFGDILDHVTDHFTMFYLVAVTTDSTINWWANFGHLAVVLGYMALKGHYFKHTEKGNFVTRAIEANNYWNLPATLYAANTFLVPLVKLSYATDHKLAITATTEFVLLADFAGLLVTVAYSIAVWV